VAVPILKQKGKEWSMTKTERLLFILNIFRVRKAARIDELAAECNVSKRTIYRDLQALMAMDIPIYCSDGYNLVEQVSLPPLNFTREEQELLGFSLKTTPLRRSPSLDKIIRNVELKIISAIPHMQRNRLCELIVDSERRRSQFTPETDEIVATCLKALMTGRQLKIRMRIDSEAKRLIKPKALRIRERDWELEAIGKPSGEKIKIALKDIIKWEI
jgi:predicted DNA-binding transcriptional regulator YafY